MHIQDLLQQTDIDLVAMDKKYREPDCHANGLLEKYWAFFVSEIGAAAIAGLPCFMSCGVDSE